ncbi:MAG: hypothetical protein N2515_08245, partial [Deltaproteobacteria bacterium]|nr:hypothetical protein [Deltaproteobacteria bacterium]
MTAIACQMQPWETTSETAVSGPYAARRMTHEFCLHFPDTFSALEQKNGGSLSFEDTMLFVAR